MAMAALLALATDTWAQTCPLKPWMTFRGTPLWRSADGKAYAYKTDHIEIDADGAPRAYCPGDTGLDLLRNAGFPGSNWADVLIPDPLDPSRPYVQTEGPGKGCYLSGTSLRSKTNTDPTSYADATVVPYMVFPGSFLRLSGTGYVGDFAAMRSADGKHRPAAIVGDTGGGPKAPLGEISIALAKALGGRSPSPRNGVADLHGPITVVVFRGSHEVPVWPVDLARIESRSAEGLAALGGWEAIEQCPL